MIWRLTLLASVCFTGPIGYGIGFLAGEHQWRSMFWITGAMTIVWACVIGIFLPDNPVSAKFVTERQKAIVIDKIRQDQTGVENKTFKKDQMIEALLDPKTWLMFFFHIWISSKLILSTFIVFMLLTVQFQTVA
jgi:ACS family allantoate permease-like MFS transporter